MTDNLVNTTLTLAQLSGSIESLSAWITSITCVDLVSLLLTREDNLCSVDDDNVVSTIYVRSERWLILATQQLCHFRAKATNNLVTCIDYDPLLLSCFLVNGNSLVT